MVLALVLFFPAVGLVWRPLAGMVGGIAVALLVLTLARDCSRPRFILIGIGVSGAGGRGRHLYDHRRRTRRADGDDLAGGQPAGRHLAAAGGGFCWALPGAIILFCTARAADVALLGDRTAVGLGVRLQQLTVLRFCAGAADLGQRLLRRQPWICGPDGAAYGAFRAARRPVSLLCGSALIGALLVLATDTLGRLAFAPLQIPAGIVIARGLPVLRCLALASP